MTLEEKKRDLQHRIAQLLQRDYVRDHRDIEKELRQLHGEIDEDQYIIVVLGEFKRGKSTFINALLGEALLPVDVLPETAVLHVLTYGEKPQVQVLYGDGTTEEGESSNAYLQQFTARHDRGGRGVKYISITCPAAFLKHHIALIDTPGVADMNDQRCDVTYGILPRANAVIFLLDATAPLKKTEKEFIDTQLLPQGIEHLLFVANKYDHVDEEEEQDTMKQLKLRLEKAFADQLPHIALYPLSAKHALEAAEKGDTALWEQSGMAAVQEAVQDLAAEGRVEQEKLARYRRKLEAIKAKLAQSLRNEWNLKKAGAAELQELQKRLTALLEEREGDRERINKYVEKEQENIFKMTDKSLQFFHGNLEEGVLELVQDYRGADFKNYMEIQISRHVQRELEGWTARYTPHVDELLHKLEQELAQGLSYHFHQSLHASASRRPVMAEERYSLSLSARDLSNTDVAAGAVAAAGGLGLMVAVGSAFMPFVSFAAMPLLRRKMLEVRLTEAKAEVVPELQNQLIQCFLRLQETFHTYIKDRCRQIQEDIEIVYERALLQFQQQTQKEQENKRAAGRQVQADIQRLEAALKELSSS